MSRHTNFKQFVMLLISNFITLIFGFFLAINLSTVLGQTGDWGLLTSSVLITSIEIINKLLYKNMSQSKSFPKKIRKVNLTCNLLNNIKIGFLYGFFVEAFKLGS